MKVLFFIPTLGAGGAETSLLASLPYLIERGVEPFIAHFENQGSHTQLTSKFAAKAPLYPVAGNSRRQRIFGFAKLLRKVEPTIVHSSVMEANLVSRLACIGKPTVLINSLVNTPYAPLRLSAPGTNLLRHRALQLVDAITSWLLVDHFHAVNESVKEEAVRRLWLRPRQITVVERGREGARFVRPREERERTRGSLGLEEHDFVLITVGRQCYQKGQIYLLQAFEEFLNVCPSAKLLIVGKEGDSTERLRAFSGNRSVEGSLKFLGHRDDIPDLLHCADLFVFPSLFEGIGGAVIEAMASRLPVIATDIPGLRETLGPAPEVCYPSPGDSAHLSRCLAQLYRDQTTREKLGEGPNHPHSVSTKRQQQ